MSIIDEIAKELRINKKIIESQLFASRKQVKKIRVPKKNEQEPFWTRLKEGGQK